MLLGLLAFAHAYTLADLATAVQRRLPPEAIESIANDVTVSTSDDVIFLLQAGVPAELIRSITAGQHPTNDEVRAAAVRALPGDPQEAVFLPSLLSDAAWRSWVGANARLAMGDDVLDCKVIQAPSPGSAVALLVVDVDGELRVVEVAKLQWLERLDRASPAGRTVQDEARDDDASEQAFLVLEEANLRHHRAGIRLAGGGAVSAGVGLVSLFAALAFTPTESPQNVGDLAVDGFSSSIAFGLTGIGAALVVVGGSFSAAGLVMAANHPINVE